MPIIPALRKLRKEDHKFKASVGYKKKNSSIYSLASNGHI
jgi:hypothetical protein